MAFLSSTAKNSTPENLNTLKIFVATWNVGGKSPENGLVLDDFLQLHSASDIYVLGFQEIVPLNAGNVLVIEDSEPAAKWLALINQTLNGPHNILQTLRKTVCPKYPLKAIAKQLRTESKTKLKMCTCSVSDIDIDKRYNRDSCFWCRQPSNTNDGDLSSEEEDGPNEVHFPQITSKQKYSLIEIVPLNAGNVLVIEDSEPAAKWLALINQTLNGPHNILQTLRKTVCPKYPLKAIAKQLRTESKTKLKMCTCSVSDIDIDKRYNRDSCFWCRQPSNTNDGDLSSEEEDGPNEVHFPQITSKQKYSLIVSKQMVGIFLTIWVRVNLVQYISHLKSSCISRGILGFGNKGCIAVSMLLHETSFCFICSHLASGEKEGDEIRRNSDVIEILKNTQFLRRCKVPNTRVPERILEHDRIIWLGDLNYRIALSLTEALKLVKKTEWDTLLSKDQLKIERDAGRVFAGWQEGLIKFAPTYKYSFNSDTYLGEADISPSKRRTPAWCDRILWKGDKIRQLSYERKDSNKYQFSDHRPVYATFSVKVVVRETSNSNFIKIEGEELLPSRRNM